jgi:hypothetical protein
MRASRTETAHAMEPCAAPRGHRCQRSALAPVDSNRDPAVIEESKPHFDAIPFHSMSTLLRRTLTAPRSRSQRAAPWLLASPFLLLFAVQSGALPRPKALAEPGSTAAVAPDCEGLHDPAAEPYERSSGAGAAESLHRALQR